MDVNKIALGSRAQTTRSITTAAVERDTHKLKMHQRSVQTSTNVMNGQLVHKTSVKTSKAVLSVGVRRGTFWVRVVGFARREEVRRL